MLDSKVLITSLLSLLMLSCNQKDKGSNNDKTILDTPTKTRTYLNHNQHKIYEAEKSNFNKKSAAKLYAKAAYFVQNKKFDSAILYAKEADKVESGNKLVLKDLGIVYTNKGELDSAKKYFRKSMAIDSAYSFALSGYGQCLYKQDSNKRAIHYYNKAIKHDRNNATYFFNKAIAYQKRGMMDSCCHNLKIAENKKGYGVKQAVKKWLKRYNCAKSDDDSGASDFFEN